TQILHAAARKAKGIMKDRDLLAVEDCDRQVRDLTAYAERAGWNAAWVFKEQGSGVNTQRKERKRVMELARARKIDAVLVTELSRWGRSLQDLLATLQELHSYGAVVAQTGLQFDLSTPQGKLFASIMGGLAEFERDLLSERVKSGMAAAKARGSKIGRQPGQKVRPHPLTPQVLNLVRAGASYLSFSTRFLSLSPPHVIGSYPSYPLGNGSVTIVRRRRLSSSKASIKKLPSYLNYP